MMQHELDKGWILKFLFRKTFDVQKLFGFWNFGQGIAHLY
jgi:hypothetical protein